MNRACYALVDCNNFYVSCERLFNPTLVGRPVIVLSNNDGCAIARSAEAKALGIPMGAPYFKIKSLCDTHRVAVLSSNYELYGDISERVMKTLMGFSPAFEIYSIDEAFLKISLPSRPALEAWAHDIQHRVLKWVGIPVSVGVAPNKTLAKVANHWAKQGAGVRLLTEAPDIEAMLHKTPVEEIWGVGRRNSQALRRQGIETALAMQKASPKFLRRLFTVTGEKIWGELNGQDCIGLEDITQKKMIQYGRSFGAPVTLEADLLHALGSYTEQAFYKLRKEKLLVQQVYVYAKTSPWALKKTYLQRMITLEHPTDDTRLALKAVRACGREMFQPGYLYKKAGIGLTQLTKAETTTDLFGPVAIPSPLMRTLDQLNQRFGKRTLTFADQLRQHNWAMQSRNRSPAYTTCWKSLPGVV